MKSRFIPTRVGQIQYWLLVVSCHAGSSPRVWGRLYYSTRMLVCQYRFIPTRVGQINYGNWALSNGYTVHPHACGADDSDPSVTVDVDSGSSPRVWGRYFLVKRFLLWHAGSSPRVWGRFRLVAHVCQNVGGSSPRVWGRWGVLLYATTRAAGSSPRVWGRCKTSCIDICKGSAVHPHACGADATDGTITTAESERFIPTRVGQILPKMQL